MATYFLFLCSLCCWLFCLAFVGMDFRVPQAHICRAAAGLQLFSDREPIAFQALRSTVHIGSEAISQIHSFVCGQNKSDAVLYGPCLMENRDGEYETFGEEEIRREVEYFFCERSAALTQVLDKIFKDHGKPTGYIVGQERSGALIMGLRYGEGVLRLKNGAARHVYWQSPTIGLDLGGSVDKVFTLLFNLYDPQSLFQRFLGVDGSIYVVGGYSVNYQQRLDVFLAPVRCGRGFRVGVSVGYMRYTDRATYSPF